MSAIKTPGEATPQTEKVHKTTPRDAVMADTQADSTLISSLKGVTYDPNTTAILDPHGWVDLLTKMKGKK
jgi:hypothetical protein